MNKISMREKLILLQQLSQEMSLIKPHSLASANNLVFSDGNCMAKLLLIGEAPGEHEDKCKTPFVGKSGELLDRILLALKMTRRDVYITNVVPWRPQENRTPTQAEIDIFVPFLQRHINIIAPSLIVLLGSIASRAILASQSHIWTPNITMGALREKFYNVNFGPKNYCVAVTYHPSFLLRSPGYKVHAWQDWQKIEKKIQSQLS